MNYNKNDAISSPAPHKPRFAVIGGLGAVAGTDILHRIVKSTPARSDEEHLDIAFVQRPFHEHTTPADHDYDPIRRKLYVYDALTDMEADNREVALLPCFISQTFLPEILPEVKIQVLGIADAIKDHIQRNFQDGPIGILTSNYVRKLGLFDKVLGDKHQIIYPSEPFQSQLMDAVYGAEGLKAGGTGKKVESTVREACEDLIKQGASIILPGFTEIPAMLDRIAELVDVPVLNSNQIYADYALACSKKTPTPPFKIGVVGGVGPAATTDFMGKVVANTHASKDQDHIKMLVEQNPQIPDRTENIIGNGIDPSIALYSVCKKLEQGGANIVAIPCNTAHAYVERIQRNLSIPIVNMLRETVNHITTNYTDVKTVGLLATTGTVKSKLYQQEAAEADLLVIAPSDAGQAQVMDAIYGKEGVKAGFTSGHCVDQLTLAYHELENAGAEVVILGCTELPLIPPDTDGGKRPALLDPTKILAQKCIEIATKFSNHS